jgi:hypothetical protein
MVNLILSFLMVIFSSSPRTPVTGLYDSLEGTSKPGREIFSRSISGLQALADNGKLKRKDIITIIDYSLPSTEKRLWVIDLSSKRILYHSLVAHGKNSGDNIASKFSNKHESLQSSLGFFITGNEYKGKHGRSLKLIGVEKNINDAAEQRAIVIHGADYVSEKFVKTYGRLGRSFGCPAIPTELHDQIIDTVGTGSCLFIYYPDSDYLKNSTFGA